MLERVEHEILTVRQIVRADESEPYTVKTHHTMFAHVQISGPQNAVVGTELTLQAQLVRWDDQTPITDEVRDLMVVVDGQQVDAVTTASGAATCTLQFSDPGTYQVEVTGERVKGASLEVTVV